MSIQPRYRKGDHIGGRYLVHQALLGGMGEVYLCLDLEENHPYALKTFQQRYLTNPHIRQLFAHEVGTWVSFEKHPNIVRCFRMETLDNQPFMFLEWVAGEEGRGTDLRSWLRHGPLDLRTALDFTIDICRGLIHAQAKQRGIVHRDLKPENILVAQGKMAKITDFGLASLVQQAGAEPAPDGKTLGERQSMIGASGIVGTPPYMAPEQWRGESGDVRTDIYAIGCIVYELLTATLPYQASTLDEFQRLHTVAVIPAIAATDHLPATLNTILAGCLAKQPEKRFADTTALLDALIRLYQAEFGGEPRPLPTMRMFTAVDYINRGFTYHQLGRYHEALADYNCAIEHQPTLAQAYNNRGNTFKRLGHIAEALADYNHAIVLNPNYAKAYINRGSTYDQMGRFEEALKDYTCGIERDPTEATAYINRGSTYHQLRRSDEALRDYNRAIELAPVDALAHMNRGGIYAELGRFEDALIDLTSAIALDPSEPKAYYNHGLAYAKLGRFEDALADFTQAIILDPTDAKVYLNRGSTYRKLRRYQEALRDYSQALAINPAESQTYYNRALTYNHLGDFDQALADFTQTVTLVPNFALAYYNRALAYHDLGRYEDALADFTRAVALDPTLALAYYKRGITYDSLGQVEEALADYSQAIALDPTNAEVCTYRGLTYFQLGRYQEALADYNRAITLDPADALTYNARGLAYARLRRFDEAMADYTSSIERNPSFAPAFTNIGRFLANQGQLRVALSYFEQAAQLGDPQAKEYVARVRKMLGMAPVDEGNPAQKAFEAFQHATSLTTMHQAVTQFPFMTDPQFIDTIEYTIAEHVPPAHRPAFEQRLAWLREIASEQR
jgi:tetratricopeptide (TPR) repeat protein